MYYCEDIAFFKIPSSFRTKRRPDHPIAGGSPMRILFVVGLLLPLAACKTVNSKAALAQAGKAETGGKPNLQDMMGEYEFVGGQYIVKDNYDRPYSRSEIKSDPSRSGTFTFKADGAYTLAVNFEAGASRGGTFGPGVLVSINPVSKPKIEQYTYSNQGWVGESVSMENKIETVDAFEPGDPDPGVTLSETKTMSSRQYKWFNKDEWKKFKSIKNKIYITQEALSFTSYSEDEMWKETIELNFKRK